MTEQYMTNSPIMRSKHDKSDERNSLTRSGTLILILGPSVSTFDGAMPKLVDALGTTLEYDPKV
jgi:hypothetical protein